MRSPSITDEAVTKEAVKSAVKRRQAAEPETIDAAWQRILSMKNTDTDAERLRAVRVAMAEGLIGRVPSLAAKRFSKAEALRLWAELHELNRAETLRKMVEEMPVNYLLITTAEALAWIVELLRDETIVAVDTETTGVDVYTDVIVGISLTLPVADVHVYIPVAHDEGPQLDRNYALSALRPFLYDTSIGKVLHNAIFDIAMFRRHGSDLRGVTWDTMTAMHALNENEESFRLKDLATKYLAVPSDTFDSLFGKAAKFNMIPLDIALVYAAKDTDLTWKLYQFQRRHFVKLPSILEYYQTVEVPLLYVIVDLESNGYILDLDFAAEYGRSLQEQAKRLHTELFAALSPHHTGDEPLNLNSNQQLKPALSSAIGEELPNLDAKKTLKPLAGQHEVIAKLLEYRKITKLSGTYIDTLPTKQNPTTGRWHSRFNPMGTVTGRFSSGKDEDSGSSQQFNVQNQPYEARRMFVAPPGKVIVGADFKAQEIRCVAYLSGEPALVEAFEKGLDPYAMLAVRFTGKPYEQVNKNPDGSDTKERKMMKVAWLAALYGTSKYTMAEQLGTTPDEAAKFMTELFDSLPVLRDWIKSNERFAEKHGFVWMDREQRKRRLPDATIRAKWGDRDTFRKKNRAMRQATNARVQGSSSIQTKVTMNEADDYCKSRDGWRLWGSVHDELLFEIPEDFTRNDIEVIRKLMTESYAWGDVKNGTDIEVMRRWGEGMSVDEWFNAKERAA
ncbi:DNA polymerase [Paenibacillus sp. NPDC057967]|uniref:DNA polymerase n=1 Tax=Paenibacillus sp. NPDC057967 TaxID=3346293 RepID=UPI0036DA702F